MYIQEGINVNVRKFSIIKSWVVKREKQQQSLRKLAREIIEETRKSW